MKVFFVCFLCFCGCSCSNIEEVRRESNHIMEVIACELESVEKKDDLKKIIPSLSDKFERLVDLVILADSLEETSVQSETKGSSLLFAQMKRIYQMHEGRDLIEAAQLKGLKKLEKHFSFEKVHD